ncbi:MAG: hypothetical protein IJ329_03440 [Clostridia bacterium]|nr:hypothetical protein [Clostridia bacterium]
MSKSKAKSIVSIIVSIISFVIAAVMLVPTIKNLIESQREAEANRPKAISAPADFTYDEETYTLSWGSVENATGYVLDYNGREIELEKTETEYTVLLTATENAFKIKAKGNGDKYLDSDWSQTLTYTMGAIGEDNGSDNAEQEISLYDKINMELARAAQAKGYTLERVIGIPFAQTTGLGLRCGIDFMCIVTKRNVEYSVAVCYNMEKAITICELIDNLSKETFSSLRVYSTVVYNSAEKFIASKNYAGEMKKLYEQGYEITVLDSCVREGITGSNLFRFEIVGTYKAVHENGDVKYFTSVNQVDVLNVSSAESYNYEPAFNIEGRVEITETQYILHEEGGTLEYMAKLIEQQERALAEKESA